MRVVKGECEGEKRENECDTKYFGGRSGENWTKVNERGFRHIKRDN